MESINFKQANKFLVPPSELSHLRGYPSKEVYINAHSHYCTSCWKLSWWELIKVIFTRRIWVTVFMGNTQPPIELSTKLPDHVIRPDQYPATIEQEPESGHNQQPPGYS